MALNGGLGVIHHNCSVAEQVDMVRKAKMFENGFISDPVCLGPDAKVKDVLAVKEKYGFCGIPITGILLGGLMAVESGKIHSKLMGIVTSRDVDFLNSPEELETPLRDIMTKACVSAQQGISLTMANGILKESRKGKLPIVDESGNLVSLVSRSDLIKTRDYPWASKKKASKQLIVAAAVSTHMEDRYRLAELVKAGLDIVVLDSSQGASCYQIEMIKFIKEQHPDIDVIAGNVVTVEQARHLILAGADGLRVGMGSGSICITQEGIFRVNVNVKLWLVDDRKEQLFIRSHNMPSNSACL
jgi:IMP dehydrogenase